MSASWEAPLNEQESLLLQPFVTNTDKPVFCLRNLPEVVKGALFSRYSRTEKDLRRVLLDEFINASEANFDRIVGGIDDKNDKNSDRLVAIQQAEAFYDRVLVGYGDDSVAELGGAHIACEEISNIAAKVIEDSRLGISPLEKSTRYVPFNRKVNDRYRYYREPAIMASPFADRYEATLDNLFDTYSALIDPLVAWIKSGTPKDDATSERAYNSATRAKALDLLRGLLPMATLTNVGLFGNGRSYEYLLTKMSASPHAEVSQLGAMMQHELDCVIPSFVKRSKSDRGAQYAHYLATNRLEAAKLAQELPQQTEVASSSTIELVEYDRDAEVKTVAAILYPHTDLTLAQVHEYVKNLSAGDREKIIQAYVGDRQSRFHRPGRAFEETYYTFDLLADLGAYRDLHRHRVLTQERQDYTVRHGYIVPPELVEAGLAESYQKALECAAETTELIRTSLPEAAQYVVPFAFRVRWRMRLNLREAYHLIELRSARQGHTSYRAVAQEMYRQILAVHPTLVAGMSFVDLNNYDLERLAAEQRLDTKLQQKSTVV
jgi:thymidylate synthase ThyX